MTNSELQRDKGVTREVQRLFWRAMLQTKLYFALTILLFVPSFFMQSIYVPLQIAYALEAIITKDFDSVPGHALIILVTTIMAQGIYAIGTWAFNRNGVYGAAYVQRLILTNYLNKDYEFYGSSHIGTLGAQAARLPESFTDYNRVMLHDIVRSSVIILASMAVIAYYVPVLALVTLACMAVVLSFNIIVSGYRLKYRRIVSAASSKVSGMLGDALSHGATVKSYATERYEEQRLDTPIDEWQKAQVKSWDMFVPLHFTRQVMLAITMGILLLVSANLYKQGAASIAIITVVQLYIIRLVNATFDISEMIKTYEGIMSTAYEPVATMLVPTSVKEATNPRSLTNKKSFGLIFDSVRYRYPDAAKNTDAIYDFSLSIKPGEKIGLIGYSGGGKTTVTKLLLRFMDVDSGTINIDGVSIGDLRQADLRSAIAYVPQEPLLFHRSIRENIAYGRPNASHRAIEAAAKIAYVDEFVKDLPRGYDTMVGERGVKLSGGQRQRVAIARALLKDAPILVLDEATSSLDSQSELYIQKALWELMKHRTAIVIAHRLSTIQRMDRIIVMDQGKIVQIGTHKQLLKNKKGIYARLWAHQSDGYILEA